MKLYKNTVLVCALCAVLTLVASIIIEFLNRADNSVCLLIQNYCVSLCCSSVLVLVPALLQYHSEKTRTLKEIEKILYDVSSYIIIGSDDGLSKRQYELIAQNLQDLFQKMLQWPEMYSPFFPSKSKGIVPQLDSVLKALMDFTLRESRESCVAAVRGLSDTEKGKEIVEITMEIVKDSAPIRVFKEYLAEFDNQSEAKDTGLCQNTEHID